MTLPRTLNSYADIPLVLAQTLATKGGRFTLATKGQAHAWRTRAYRWRLLYQESLKVGKVTPPTPYDLMRLRIDPADECTVIIDYEPRLPGILTLPGADTPVKLDPTSINVPMPKEKPKAPSRPKRTADIEGDAEMLAAALSLAQSLGADDPE